MARYSAPLQLNYSAEDIQRGVEKAIADASKVLDSVAAQSAPTFANAVAPLAQSYNVFAAATRVLTFLQYVSPSEAVRDASSKADMGFAVERDMHAGAFAAVRAVLNNYDEMSGLDPEDQRLVEHMEKQFRRNGVQLGAEQRQRVSWIDKRVGKLEIDFVRNISQDKSCVLLSCQELDGLPAEFFSNRKVKLSDGIKKLVVATRPADIKLVLQHATSEATRKTAYVAHANRCPENIALLREAVDLRLEKATLLGYASYAEYALEDSMIKTPDAVVEMEMDLVAKLLPLARKEMAQLCALKREEQEAAGLTFTGIYEWDYNRYTAQAAAQQSKLDVGQVKEYFALEMVLPGVLQLYASTLGLNIVEANGCSDVWHPRVQHYRVWEADGSAFIGDVLLDLYERPDKYQEVAVWPIRPGFEREDGSRETPVSALVASFPEPTAAVPHLLSHNSAISLVQALGHIFQNLCAKSKWACCKLPRDYMTISAQMFTQWMWQPAALRTFARHYQTNEPIPEELCARLAAARAPGSALKELRQVFRGLYDIDIHTNGNFDVRSHYNEVAARVALVNNGDADVGKAATLAHLMEGYSGLYASFMLAAMASSDMFESRFATDIASPRAGADFRAEVLQPGGSRDPATSIERFLGRQPTSRAFLTSIGLHPVSHTRDVE
ncbi:metalloendopeptidase [Coemansia sp. RSA 2711]|nr:metalloendopeptidase [Coemansia sp. RSA 2711]